MSGARTRGTGAAGGRWAFWRYNWLAHHKRRAALERARGFAHGALLDVGCGSMPFAPLFEGAVASYTGTDLFGSGDAGDARPFAYATAGAQPFRDATFDTVLALAMLSYLPEPQAMLLEARRVLRPGGVLIVECVQMAPLYPLYVDYWRFTRHGAAHLLARSGFEPVEFIPIGGLWARVGLALIAPLNRINRGPLRVLTEIPVRLLYAAIQLACEALDRVAHDPDDVLAHLVVARRKP